PAFTRDTTMQKKQTTPEPQHGAPIAYYARYGDLFVEVHQAGPDDAPQYFLSLHYLAPLFDEDPDRQRLPAATVLDFIPLREATAVLGAALNVLRWAEELHIDLTP